MKLSLAQMRSLAASVGFPDPALAAAVAMAESGGDASAYNTEGSYGLWQIDIVYNPRFQSNPDVLFDPTTNAKAAYGISQGGKNWNPWTTYRTGLYRQWYTPPSPAPSGLSPSQAGAIAGVAVGITVLVVGLAFRVNGDRVLGSA